jgi:hypothetical protein
MFNRPRSMHPEGEIKQQVGNHHANIAMGCCWWCVGSSRAAHVAIPYRYCSPNKHPRLFPFSRASHASRVSPPRNERKRCILFRYHIDIEMVRRTNEVSKAGGRRRLAVYHCTPSTIPNGNVITTIADSGCRVPVSSIGQASVYLAYTLTTWFSQMSLAALLTLPCGLHMVLTAAAVQASMPDADIQRRRSCGTSPKRCGNNGRESRTPSLDLQEHHDCILSSNGN